MEPLLRNMYIEYLRIDHRQYNIEDDQASNIQYSLADAS